MQPSEMHGAGRINIFLKPINKNSPAVKYVFSQNVAELFPKHHIYRETLSVTSSKFYNDFEIRN